jgi:hypothetical protein
MGACLAITLLSGCAHIAKHYSAPDFAPVEVSETRLAVAVTKAQGSAQQEGTEIDTISGQADTLFKAAPPELRPQIAAMQADLVNLKAANVQLRDQVGEALAAKDEMSARLTAVEAESAKVTGEANAAEQAWAKDSQQLTWMKVHWFIGVIVLIGGLALCALVAFLKFTGRLATAGAAVASKL